MAYPGEERGVTERLWETDCFVDDLRQLIFLSARDYEHVTGERVTLIYALIYRITARTYYGIVAA